ncbi:MAG: acyltransferase [Chitinophagaceae bacterium]|nr:MAG: acyltransferase [Chitinophagaceae bacterium]
MASIRYLWLQRAKFPLTSAKFYRAWGKRLFSFNELMKRNSRRRFYLKKGADIDETAELGEVTIRGKYKYLRIGCFSFLGKVTIDLHDKVVIGNRVCINDGVEILTGSHAVDDPKWHLTTGDIIIEDYVWIGTGAMILPGVRLGKGAVVGARAVVSKSVAPGMIVVGNPSKPVSKVRVKELDYNPCEFLASNQAWLKG